MRAWILAVVLVIAAGAAAGEAAKVRGFWLPATADLWERVPASGLRLKNREGVTRHVAGELIKNVVAVKADLERASGVRAQLGLVDTETPVAGAVLYQGKPTLVVSLVWLEQLGRDRDAIAVMVGHELAHVGLGHLTRSHGESSFLQALLGGSSVELEREADEQGLRWAAAAGYDPCGGFREFKFYGRFRAENGMAPSSHHPALASRAAAAERASGRSCD